MQDYQYKNATVNFLVIGSRPWPSLVSRYGCLKWQVTMIDTWHRLWTEWRKQATNWQMTYKVSCMAVGSSQGGRVCGPSRLNVYTCTLWIRHAREVVQYFTDKKVTLHQDFQPFGFTHSLLWQTLCCLWHVHAAKFCIRGLALFPRSHPAFHCLQYVLSATESWVAAWKQDYSFSTQCESESFLPAFCM